MINQKDKEKLKNKDTFTVTILEAKSNVLIINYKIINDE